MPYSDNMTFNHGRGTSPYRGGYRSNQTGGDVKILAAIGAVIDRAEEEIIALINNAYDAEAFDAEAVRGNIETVRFDLPSVALLNKRAKAGSV